MIERMLKKKVVAGAVAAVVLAGGGAAIAATQFGSDAEEQAILNDAAKRLGVEPSALSDALEQAYAARIDAAVAAGELTKEQGDALEERIQAGDVPLVGGPLFGPHGPGFGGWHVLGGLDAAASYLGLTEVELRDQLESGKTLAEVAGDEGKSVAGLKQALTDAAKKDLEAAVADGRLTVEQEQDILAGLSVRIDHLVNGMLPHRPGRDGSAESATAA